MAADKDNLKPNGDAHATGEDITTQDAHATTKPVTKLGDAHATGQPAGKLGDAHATSEPIK
ncbi:hypothetical protein [Streptomyces cyaneofuscatus]|uniref:hypothetical protein n=1 Tax=Streptomyces cyaneofuscatus TaxID=66883 RepID=UPI0033BA27D9